MTGPVGEFITGTPWPPEPRRGNETCAGENHGDLQDIGGARHRKDTTATVNASVAKTSSQPATKPANPARAKARPTFESFGRVFRNPEGTGGAAQEHGQHECDQGEPVGRVGDQKGEGANQSGWPGEMTGRNGA